MYISDCLNPPLWILLRTERNHCMVIISPFCNGNYNPYFRSEHTALPSKTFKTPRSICYIFPLWRSKLQPARSLSENTNKQVTENTRRNFKMQASLLFWKGFPGDSVVKNPFANAGALGSISGSERAPWIKKWQPTPVFLPGKSHGQRSLLG